MRYLSLAVLIVLIVMAAAVPAFAGAPTTVGINDSDTLFSCHDGEFDVLFSNVGTLRWSLSEAPTGETVVKRSINAVETYTNSVTGKSFTTPNAGHDEFTFYQDGSITSMSSGIFSRIVVPGQGVATAETGRLMFQFSPGTGDWEVTFVAGLHTIDGAEFEAKVCAALAG